MNTLSLSRNRQSVDVQFMLVQLSPAIAEQYLAKNKSNRVLRPGVVEKYARDMSAGRWLFDGSPIQISKTDRMLNGQHRCHAVIASGVTIPTLFVLGVDDEAQRVMDTQAKRSYSDQLKFAGEKDAKLLAAIIRKASVFESSGQLRYSGTAVGGTESEMDAWFSAHPQVRYAVDIATRAKRVLPVPASAVGFAYYLCAEVDRGDAEEFFSAQLIEGRTLQGYPSFVLGRKFTAANMSADKRKRMDDEDVVRYSVLAWNLFRGYREVTKLQAPKGGWTKSAITPL